MAQRLGVSGDMGSFSEEAALLYAKKMDIKPTLSYLIDMETVLAAIEKEEVDLGILPVVNLHGGLVRPAFEAMSKHIFTFIDELWFDVKQCLLVLPGISVNQITKIVSHSQGLAQCRHYLQKEFTKAQRIEWCDTAKAASDLAKGILSPDTAVIAPERCARLYGLDIMARNIQDNNPNLTAFIIVQPRGG